ncbi:MAG: hypothetical protein A2W31_15245 [Planctomycetes bacterium RBG_16_64_10]|nr:MAG: hypothetical protein A2W31_15245 [Planctomycetes bacterium RBG_16_64_10]
MADQLTEPGNLGVALTAMANGLGNASALASQGFQAAADARTRAADQLASDSQRMWSIAMTTPTVNAALGYRTVVESGAGRTRAETNRPSETSSAGA